MKLLNQSLQYLSISILLIVTIWSVIFYTNMLDEIYDSIDDGLENYKVLIIQKAKSDSTILHKIAFDESNYAIQEVSETYAQTIRERYTDTLLYMLSEEDLEPVRMLTTAFKHEDRYFQLQVISSMVEEDDLMEDLLWSTVWLYLILVASIIIINNIVLQKLWKPFYKILHQLKSFRLDSNEKLPDIQTNTTEFNELKIAANDLIQHSLETYTHQKQFTENAAHELQTPLAIVTNRLELLLEKEELETAQAESIAEVLQIIERLIRLNKTLLLLTKIENKQYFDNQPISINTMVEQCLDELEDFASFKNIKISIVDSNPLTVEMDATLATMLISNLIKNAIYHNIPDGTVTIAYSKTGLRICNPAKGQPLNADKIFNRFHKDSSEENSSGTGLGLAVAKAICKLYGFSITYQFDGQHCFEVNFKKIGK